MPGRRRATLVTLAQAVDEGEINLSVEADPTEAGRRLLALPGIGPWTAGYITMRAFGHPDAWPVNDLVLARRMGLDRRRLAERAEAWRPWRAYAALTIWSAARTSNTPGELHAARTNL